MVSVGYIRLRIVVLKDQANRKSHEESAQLACEAAGSIRTVASLTREDDCCRLYSLSLEEPLRKSSKNAIWSNALYALSQSMSFFVIALVFWYGQSPFFSLLGGIFNAFAGSRLVSEREFSTFQFFVGLMASNEI